MTNAKALIAEDEPLLRQSLRRQLATLWPELEVVAEARNGREALAQFQRLQPDICFLDVHMPGLSGVETARRIGRRSHLVFITAFNSYAVEAFAQGALDYLVKPVEMERLADTVARLQERLRTAQPAPDAGSLLEQLAAQMERKKKTETLRWIRASVGSVLRLIPVDDVHYLRADDKYTLVAWCEDRGEAGDALIRTPLAELLSQLDPEQFAQVHRSVVVNLSAVSHLVRKGDTARIHLRHRSETLPVSRRYLHLFRQM
ncbi:LytR/AlgR family response regulator transcription factor [Microbulbifer sp. 2201CG32-9]|uniref:LytR/AlgR family response regulator transcription factor n=1 Tax=Microbulbifer sp. 2201CG32-9 TaxID=3232309 RepID=UPI00345B97B2